jgi:hypothetical protein
MAAKTPPSGSLVFSTTRKLQKSTTKEGTHEGRLHELLEEAKMEDIPETKEDGTSRKLSKYPRTFDRMKRRTCVRPKQYENEAKKRRTIQRKIPKPTWEQGQEEALRTTTPTDCEATYYQL